MHPRIALEALKGKPLRDKMANENVFAPAPTRSDDQILPFAAWLIICHLGRTHNIYQRSASPFHLAKEDLRHGNLKFIPKGEDDEVFGMPIPNELISDNIRNAPYYNAYLEIVAKHDRKVAAEKGGKKKPTTAKQLKSNPVKEKSSKPAPAPKPKGTQVKPAKPSHAKHSKFGKVLKTRKGKSSLQLIDEDEPTQPEPKTETEPEHQEATRTLFVVEGKKKAIATEEQAAQSLLALHTPKRRITTDQFIFQRRTPAIEEASTGPSVQPHDDASANIVRESSSPADAETVADTDKTNSGEEPLSSIGTLSSMKNLDDAYTIGDQFLNDKSTEDDPGKLNVEAEVVSMVTVPIYQASSSAPPLSTPIIDLSPPKHVSFTTQAPIFTATTTTTTTTTLSLPPPPQQQSTTDSELAARVTTLERKFADFEQKSQTLDNTTRNLGSSVVTLELRDLPHKINQTVNEVVKEARMFETGTYKSLPEHVALYEALEAFMERANRDKFFAEKDKSRKRRRDDQDPPPPPPDSDPSKKRRHDSDASGSSQPPAPQSSAWKTEALEITHIDQANQFVSPPSGDVIMNFVNELGYTEAQIPNSSDALRHNYKTHNIYQRSASPFHLAKEDLRHGNLKFIPKGKDDEVFGMPIPNELISNNIRNAPYYNAYLEIVAKHDRKVAAEKGGKKKPATAKQLKSNPVKEKSSKPAPAPKPKGTQVKPAKPSPAKHSKFGKVLKTHKGKSSLQLVDEDEPTQPEPKPETEPEHQEATRTLFVVEGKKKAIATEEQAAQLLLALHTPKRRITTDQFIFKRRTPAIEEASTGPSVQPQDDASANIVRESSSPADAETVADTDKTNSGEEPLSSIGTLSSMKNLDDAYTIGDQFLNDKSTEDDPGKLNVEAEVVSMVTVPIYQASSSAPPLSTPIIDLSPPKHFFAEKDKSRKRRRDDQNPPPPPPDSDPSKKRRHDSDTSGSSQPPAPQSSAWKTSYTKGWMSFVKRFDTAPVCHSKPLDSMDLFAFIRHSDLTKVRIGERDLAKRDVKLLKMSKGRTVSLDPLITAASGGSGNSIDKLFNEGDDAGQEHYAERDDDALEETIARDVSDVAVEKAKKKRKRKVIGDASGFTHPPKKLKDDYQSILPNTSGKFLAALRDLVLEGSGIPSGVTEPLIAAFVAPTSLVADALVVTVSVTTTVVADVAAILDLKAGVESKNLEKVCLGAEVRMWGEHTLENKGKLEDKCAEQAALLSERYAEIFHLKSFLSLKEAEAVEAIHLRGQLTSVEVADAAKGSELKDLKEKNLTLEGERDVMSEKIGTLESVNAAKEAELASLSSQVSKLTSDLSEFQLSHDELNSKVVSLESERDGLINHMSSLESAFEHFSECMEATQDKQARVLAIGYAVNKGIQDGLRAGADHRKAGRDLSDASIVDLMDSLHLEGPLAEIPRAEDLQPSPEQLRLPIHRPEDNVVKGLIGEASTSGVPSTVEHVTFVSTTLASSGFVPPLFVADYQVLDAVPHHGNPPTMTLEEEELDTTRE
nr:hypothetical protein [Tanacetum cinerariifolium]